MVGLLGEDLFEDRRSLELFGVGLVGGVERDVERQRVEDGRLAVVGIALGELFHGLLIGDGARPVVDLLGVLVERLDGGDVVALTLGPGAGRLRPLDGRPPLLEAARAGRCGEGVAEPRHGHAPVGDGAAGIDLSGFGEPLDGRVERERVQQRDPDLERRLRRGATRGREVDGAELFAFGGARRRGDGRGQEKSDEEHAEHAGEGRGANRHGWTSCLGDDDRGWWGTLPEILA